jgi:hypothetical protein
VTIDLVAVSLRLGAPTAPILGFAGYRLAAGPNAEDVAAVAAYQARVPIEQRHAQGLI